MGADYPNETLRVFEEGEMRAYGEHRKRRLVLAAWTAENRATTLEQLVRLRIENFGPIRASDVTLGDLNVSVGPQASGKSLFWQLLKLLLDAPSVRDEFRRFNIDWGKDTQGFLSLYFGEGMAHVAQKDTVIEFDGQSRPLDKLFDRRKQVNGHVEDMFYIPAQRVMALRDGLTRTFLDFRAGDPYVVRDFSDKLHRLVQTEFAKADRLFPQANRLNGHLRRLIDDAFFRGFNLELSRESSFQKKLVLKRGDLQLPVMAWSAGQREFSPLLLGLYWLMPAGKVSRRDQLSWVVIEEPEMGLHPQAISAFMALVLELLRRGYRVCLSTHSPHVLDIVWALQTLKFHGGADKDVLRLFGLPSNLKTKEMARVALDKKISVQYFKPGAGAVDISSLDPGSPEADTAGWGGLTGFTAKVGDVVSEVVTRNPATKGGNQ